MKLVLNAQDIKRAVARELKERGYDVSDITLYYWGRERIDEPYVEAQVNRP